MDERAMRAMLECDAGGTDLERVGLALVAQRVEARGHHEPRR